MGHHRRNYTDEYKAAAVERVYEPGATQGSVAREPGITDTQLKTWRLEIEAFGSAEAKAAIFEYIEVFHNRQRRHSAIGYKTPKQAFEDMTWKMAA